MQTMTNEQAKEGNKLIAEFMGLKPESEKDDRYFNCPDRYYKYDVDHYKISNTCSPEDMQYHKSWDWLMPVVFKIKQDKQLYKNHIDVMVTWEHRFKEAMFFSLTKLWLEIIEFIKWYNNETI